MNRPREVELSHYQLIRCLQILYDLPTYRSLLQFARYPLSLGGRAGQQKRDQAGHLFLILHHLVDNLSEFQVL